MKNKAFIFDMDGVIINSETTWETYGNNWFVDLVGKDIAKEMDDSLGMSLPAMYDLAASFGFGMSRENFYGELDKQAKIIYEKATITIGFSEFISFLQSQDFHLAIVSASPQNWIDMTLAKTHLAHAFTYILSLHDRDDLLHKPAPDGYIEAMRTLGVHPDQTIILEDSNRGIKAAKTSGAFTIGFREHLSKDYRQTGADVYADTLEQAKNIVLKKIIDTK